MNLEKKYNTKFTGTRSDDDDKKDKIGSDSDHEDNNNSMDLTDITCELLKNHPFVQLEQRPPK